MRRGEVKLDEVRQGKARWGEERWSEMRWGKVKCDEMRWGEAIWGDLKWSEVWVKVRWGKLRWSRLKCVEVRGWKGRLVAPNAVVLNLYFVPYLTSNTRMAFSFSSLFLLTLMWWEPMWWATSMRFIAEHTLAMFWMLGTACWGK